MNAGRILAALSVGLLPCVASAADAEAAARGSNDFAVELYGALRRADGNLFFSPISIGTALAMTSAGARGETLAQMERVLHLPPAGVRHESFGALTDRLNSLGEPVELSVANALWGQQGYAIREEFLGLLREAYGAGLTPVDFAGDTETARTTINDWVEAETRDKIVELLKPGILTPLTRLVLTNAVYFKGSWVAPFDSARTEKAPFRMSADESREVSLMAGKARYPFADRETFLALELPYEGKDLSMVVLLPKRVDGLALLEESLSAGMVTDVIGSLREQEVRVFLPKFRIAQTLGLNASLEGLGMTAAFDATKADFSGIDGTRMLYITAVVHQAYVEVNEEGTEAAAATGVVIGLRSIPRPPPVFRADHPFLFLIRDRRTGAFLFLGRFAVPE